MIDEKEADPILTNTPVDVPENDVASQEAAQYATSVEPINEQIPDFEDALSEESDAEIGSDFRSDLEGAAVRVFLDERGREDRREDAEASAEAFPVSQADEVPLEPSLVIRRVRTDAPDPQLPPVKQKGFLYSLLDTVRFISLGLVIGILLVIFVIQRNDVYGESMAPTLHENDAVFVEMVSHYFAPYSRGSIVTIDADGLPGYNKKDKIIKRVVGLPGETVEIKDGGVYINGTLLDEPYLADGVPTNVTEESISEGFNKVTLGPHEYYCMGDNRGASLDSRILGPIPDSRIKAHVIARVYPFNEMALY